MSNRDEPPALWPVTEAEIDRAVTADPDRRLTADEEAVRVLWQGSRLPEGPDDWEMLAARLRAERGGVDRRRPIPWRRVAGWAIPLAAAAALAAILVGRPGEAGDPFGGAASLALDVPAGETVRLDLAPGIHARVAPGSRFSYDARVAGDPIHVTLEGEAHFAVSGDAQRSLLVRTPNGEVRDIGTRFNVRARGERVVVAVEEGVVELSAGGSTVRVEAGQRSWAAGGAPPEPAEAADLAAHLAWTTGRFAMIDEPLEEVFAEIQRRHGTPVHLDPSLRGERLTASMRGEDENQTVQTVCAAVGARCSRTDSGWRVEAENPRVHPLTR